LATKLPDAEEVMTRLKANGVLCLVMGPRRLRFVTHVDVDRSACEEAAQVVTRTLA
jgi:threonine aldolase